MRNHTFEEDACLNKPKKHCQAAEREAMLSVPGIFCMTGKFSKFSYDTKSPLGRMHTRANGRCCRKTTALGARIPLCRILLHVQKGSKPATGPPDTSCLLCFVR